MNEEGFPGFTLICKSYPYPVKLDVEVAEDGVVDVWAAQYPNGEWHCFSIPVMDAVKFGEMLLDLDKP
jgi:hypothetical protein